MGEVAPSLRRQRTRSEPVSLLVAPPLANWQNVKRQMAAGLLDPAARLLSATVELGINGPGTRLAGRDPFGRFERKLSTEACHEVSFVRSNHIAVTAGSVCV